MSDLTAFLLARLDEDEVVAKDHLCIHCGCHTAPLLNAFGITGYTHDGRMSNGRWEYGWQGVRCQNRLTGAEPVQNPARVLRQVEAGRAILARYDDCLARQEDPDYPAGVARDQAREYEDFVLPNLAAVYSDHPDRRRATDEHRDAQARLHADPRPRPAG